MKNILVGMFYFCVILSGFTQDLDVTFGNSGIKITDLSSVIDDASNILVSSQNEIFISGQSIVNADINPVVLKFNSTGQLVAPDFDSDGIRSLDDKLANALTPFIIDDSRIFVTYTEFDGNEFDYKIIALDKASGSFDNTFNTTGELSYSHSSTSEYVISVKKQDDKILVLGTSEDKELIRINTSGSIDNTFGSGGYLSLNLNGNAPVAMSIDASNNIVIIAEGNNQFHIYRFLPNGNIDNSFGNSGNATIDFSGVNTKPVALAIQGDGKIIIAGNDDGNIALARLTSFGILDSEFDSDGKISEPIESYNSTVKDIKVEESTGDILVCGYTLVVSEYHMTLVRFSSTGIIEAEKTIRLGDGMSLAKAMTIQSDRKILLAGTYNAGSGADIAIVRVNPDFASHFAVSTTEPIISQNINLFPNPASNRLNIHSTFELEEITIQDMFGKTLLQTSATGNTSLDISSLSKGVYNCFVKTSKGTGIKKVVIQ